MAAGPVRPLSRRALALGLGALLLTLAGVPAAALELVELRVGRIGLELEGQRWQLAGLRLARRPDGTVALELASLRPPRPLAAPLSLRGRLDPGAGGARLHLRAGNTPLGLVLELTRAGAATALFFDSGRIQLAGLDPARLVAELPAGRWRLDGTVEAYGSLLWQKGAPRGAAELVLRGVDLVGPGVTLAGLELVLGLDRLWPPRSLPGQRLAIHRLDLGVPLEQVVVLFDLDGRHLNLRHGEARIARGRLVLDPASLDLAAGAGALRLKLQGLDLARLVALLGLEEVALEGLVDGSGQLRLQRGRPASLELRLVARGGGWLRYTGPLPQTDPRLGQLAAILRDFRYRRLVATLTGDPAGELALAVELLGTSTDVYGDRPIALNLRFTGPLGRVLASSLDVADLPARLGEALTPSPAQDARRGGAAGARRLPADGAGGGPE